MLTGAIVIACLAIAAVSIPAALWLYRRERELRATLRAQEPELSEKDIRRRVREIMRDR